MEKGVDEQHGKRRSRVRHPGKRRRMDTISHLGESRNLWSSVEGMMMRVKTADHSKCTEKSCLHMGEDIGNGSV